MGSGGGGGGGWKLFFFKRSTTKEFLLQTLSVFQTVTVYRTPNLSEKDNVEMHYCITPNLSLTQKTTRINLVIGELRWRETETASTSIC